MTIKNYTVEEVHDLFAAVVIPTITATDDGQALLNRIARSITDESLKKRKVSSRQTHAKTAFDKALAKIATMTPDKVSAFVTGKDAWIASYITRNYEQAEE